MRNSDRPTGLPSRRRAYFTVPVTPSDTTDLAEGVTQAVLVAEDGDVAVIYPNGSQDTIFLAAGMFHPVCVRRIRSTGTTATGIKAAY